jgi:hypothetical protein
MFPIDPLPLNGPFDLMLWGPQHPQQQQLLLNANDFANLRWDIM